MIVGPFLGNTILDLRILPESHERPDYICKLRSLYVLTNIRDRSNQTGVFMTILGIPMGTNCAPLLADLFLYSYEAEFRHGLLKKTEKKLARFFKFTFRYRDGVLSLNNSRFGDFVDRIYSIEPEIKDTIDTDTCASYLDPYLESDSEGRKKTNFTTKEMISIFPL